MTRVLGRVRTIGAIAGILVAAIAGGVTGVTLADRASEPAVEELVFSDPTLATDSAPALRSPGGFTGFDGRPALGGRVFRVGEVESVVDRTFDVVSAGTTAQISLRDETRLFRLVGLDGSLVAGDVILARFEGDTLTGVLRVPPDLEDDELDLTAE